MIIIYYILLVAPIWIVFRFTTNYSVLIGCRNFLKYSFAVLCILCLASFVINNIFFDTSALAENEIARKKGGGIFYLLVIPLLWNIWMALWGLKFYGSTHIENLEYFVLYLRSFKDDKKKKNKEHRLMRTLYLSFFCPFAIGRPDEIRSSGAIKLYVDDEWQENVLDMMERAPIILLRVSDTDNFFWEFEQCTVNEYIDKSLFWVSNIESYSKFRVKAAKQYNIEFPPVNNITDNCIIYKEENSFSVIRLTTRASYKEFVQAYNKSRNLVSNYYDYFCGRSVGLIKQFFLWKRDPYMMSGIQEWCWASFLFPELYIIFQRFPNRGWMYILSLAFIFAICMVKTIFLLLFIPMLLFRFLFMVYMGRNGKKMVWFSEKWESLEYFEEIHQNNNIKVIGFAVCIIIYLLTFLL